MAKAAAASPAGKKKRSLALSAAPWYGGLLCGFLFAVSLPTAVLVAITLMPAILVAAFDKEAGKHAARPTALFSATVTIPMLPGLWVGGHTVASAMAVLGDLRLILLVCLSGFAGYAISRIIPIGAAITLERRANDQVRLIRERLTTIRAEWDDIEG